MLLVRVRADRSAIHGLGVFAVKSISRGSPVWRFSQGFDLDLDPAVVEAQPPHFREYLMRYGYVDRRLHRYAGEELTVDYGTVEARGGSF